MDGGGVSINRADIMKIAALAELEVDAAAAAELEAQLSHILEYVEQLREVRDQGPAADDARATRLRKDVVAPDPLATAPEAFAPGWKQGLFTVPRLAELDRGDDAP